MNHKGTKIRTKHQKRVRKRIVEMTEDSEIVTWTVQLG